MNKRLILHAGMPKTGTTSIQETLGHSREKLLEQGIYYPSIRPFNHSFNFYLLFLDSPENNEMCKRQGIHDVHALKKAQEKFKSIWEDEFRKNSFKNFIISAELLMVGTRKEIKTRIRRLKEFVAPYFDDIKVIVYVRSPVSFLNSITQQVLRHRSQPLDEMKFIKDWNLYKAQLTAYIDEFGKENIIVRPFDKAAFKNGDLISDFLHIIDPDVRDEGIVRKKRNESLSYEACVLLSEYNRRYPRYIKGELNKDCGLASKPHIFINILSKIIDSRKFSLEFKFSRGEAERINEEVEFINQFLPEDHQFEKVAPSDEPMTFPTIDELSKEYLIDVINECNKKIEELSNRLEALSGRQDDMS